FTAVGALPRSHLAHILADGRLAAWDPNPDAPVHALALSVGTLYVGGQFNTIAGQSRSKIAALDVATGQATAWDPKATGYLYRFTVVYALSVQGDAVYVGGEFTHVGGQARSCLAAVDGRTGQALNWNPNPDQRVTAVTLKGNTAYAGGFFSRIGGQARIWAAC